MKKITLFLFIITAAFAGCDVESFDISSSDDSSETGTAGSLARFTIANNYMYTVEHSLLKVFNISNEDKPEFVKQITPGFGIETIFASGNYLFLGSRWGVYIYDITQPESPVQKALYEHTYSCDPVVVSGNYAYSTLNSFGPCGRGLNQLDIIDVSNPSHPKNVNTLPMNAPQGLGVTDNLLFVCDEGIKVFDLTDKIYPQFLHKIEIPAYDVIPLDTLLLVATEAGLYEYSFTSAGDLTELSTIYTNEN